MPQKMKHSRFLPVTAKDMPPLQTADTKHSLSSTPPNTDDADISALEIERNSLQNKQLSERVERDIQRRRHRDTVVGGIIAICIIFYTTFLALVWECFRPQGMIEKISAVWVMPLMALVTMPTILFVILIFCVYRQRPTIPSDIMRLLQRGSSDQ